MAQQGAARGGMAADRNSRQQKQIGQAGRKGSKADSSRSSLVSTNETEGAGRDSRHPLKKNMCTPQPFVAQGKLAIYHLDDLACHSLPPTLLHTNIQTSTNPRILASCLPVCLSLQLSTTNLYSQHPLFTALPPIYLQMQPLWSDHPHLEDLCGEPGAPALRPAACCCIFPLPSAASCCCKCRL